MMFTNGITVGIIEAAGTRFNEALVNHVSEKWVGMIVADVGKIRGLKF